MKNSFKMGVLALAIAVSFAACKGKGSANGDSTKTDSAKMDSAKMTDTAKKMIDTAKKKMDSAKKMTADTSKKMKKM
ncbi:MAG: hypothetical protein M3N14_09390 [Bacteroidota bacterium]|nr:hypothetical protein [Bacteroidota bacterium]